MSLLQIWNLELVNVTFRFGTFGNKDQNNINDTFKNFEAGIAVSGSMTLRTNDTFKNFFSFSHAMMEESSDIKKHFIINQMVTF